VKTQTQQYTDTAQLLNKGTKSRKKVQSAFKLITNIQPKLKPQLTRNIIERILA
jgi:hypothetical protein